MNQPSLVKPALIGGAAAGFVGAIPLIGQLLACICCCHIIAGGFLAAYLLSKEHARAGLVFTSGSGAAVGALAGVIQGIVGAVLFMFVPQPDPMETIETIESIGFEIPADLRQSILENLQQGADPGVVQVGFYLVIGVVVGLVFATLGGLLGGSIFRTRSQEPGQHPS